MNIAVRYVFSFLALIPITTMLSGDVLYRWFPTLGEGLIWIGTIWTIVGFASVRISALWKMAHLRKNQHCHRFICHLSRLTLQVPHH